MADDKNIHIDGLELVIFQRSKLARRINISVKPFQGVRVAVPRSSSLKKAEQFVFTKKAWIKKHLEKTKQYETKYSESANKPDNIEREKAKTILLEKLKYLAGRNGFSHNRVFIRNQKTRWGSCSSKNNISLNMKLIRLPEELIDYVILHELVHTNIKNHGKAFWLEMEKHIVNIKEKRSELRSYGLELY